MARTSRPTAPEQPDRQPAWTLLGATAMGGLAYLLDIAAMGPWVAAAAGAAAVGGTAALSSRLARHRLLRQCGILRVRIDASGRIVHWGDVGVAVLGYSPHEVLGKNISTLMPAPFAAEHDGYLRRFVESPESPSRVLGVRRRVVGLHRDGRQIPLSLSVRPCRRGPQMEFEGHLQAIPESGPGRDSPHPEDLTPQISWRWLRNLGHEIRTPMAGIQGHAEILVDPQATAAERHESAEAIHANSQHLLELLNDLLDHARLSAGELPIQRRRVDLHELLHEVGRMIRPSAQHRGLQLDVVVGDGTERWIDTDPLRLRQILLNLLGNALKFTERGWIRLELQTARSDAARRLWIDVADCGIGITEEFAKLLFQPFQQELRGIGSTAGSGLGLSICRRLARMLGGDLLLVDSTPDVGSRFRIELPLPLGADTASTDAPAAPPAAAAAAATQPLAATRILLVDDAADLLRVTQRSLQAAGASVAGFGNGPAALLHADQHAFDIALLDLMMPGMSGFELAQALRARGFRGAIVALSAAGDSEVAERCRAAGFDRFLAKPMRRRELVGAVCDALGRNER